MLAPIERQTTVGTSLWRAFPAGPCVDLAAAAIRANPPITHCADPACIECADAIAGGPLDWKREANPSMEGVKRFS